MISDECSHIIHRRTQFFLYKDLGNYGKMDDSK